MSNLVAFPRKFLEKFIQMYKEQRCLWDRESPAYKIKMKRLEAMSKLTKLVQEIDPSATRVHVMRKIDSLRACVRREYKRVWASRRKATTEEELYIPSLWYYDHMAFILRDYEQYENGMKVERAETNVDSEEEEQPEDDPSEHTYETTTHPIEFSAEYQTSPTVDVGNRSTMKWCAVDEDLNKKKKSSTEVEDEYDAIGINVAAKLRHLPPNMRILAEKLINDVLFQAQTNGLSPATVILTPDPFK